jgi:hypothetical protein
MYIKDIIIKIRLEHGEMEVSAPYFIISDNFVQNKMKRIAELCKVSDQNYGTNSVKEFCDVCNMALQRQLGIIRMTDKLEKNIEKFIFFLTSPLETKPKGNKKLF